MAVEIAEIERIMRSCGHHEPVVTADIGSGADVPQPWRSIADSDAAEARCAAAISLWNNDFLELVPNFAEALTTELADVRVGRVQGDAVLVYAFEHFDGGRSVVCWLGWNPALARGVHLRFGEAIPDQLRRFYRDVHAGFVAPDGISHGPIGPRHLQTFAEYVGCPEGLPESNWPADEVASTRLLVLATAAGQDLCVSPDFPPGQAMIVYGGVPDPAEDVGVLLDRLMTGQLDVAIP